MNKLSKLKWMIIIIILLACSLGAVISTNRVNASQACETYDFKFEWSDADSSVYMSWAQLGVNCEFGIHSVEYVIKAGTGEYQANQCYSVSYDDVGITVSENWDSEEQKNEWGCKDISHVRGAVECECPPPTATFTHTPSLTATFTLTATQTQTLTETQEVSETPDPTQTPEVTETQEITQTVGPTASSTPEPPDEPDEPADTGGRGSWMIPVVSLALVVVFVAIYWLFLKRQPSR